MCLYKCMVIQGFIVNPAQNRDGTIDLLNWKCYIPGKKNVSINYICYKYMIDQLF